MGLGVSHIYISIYYGNKKSLKPPTSYKFYIYIYIYYMSCVCVWGNACNICHVQKKYTVRSYTVCIKSDRPHIRRYIACIVGMHIHVPENDAPLPQICSCDYAAITSHAWWSACELGFDGLDPPGSNLLYIYPDSLICRFAVKSRLVLECK